MTDGVQQNDPSELLEVLEPDGRATGRALTRAEIHVRGEWHRAFHCWIVRDGGQQVVLQRRSLAKDTYPGRWDAAAAGHWRFGESAEQAAREIEEELGLSVSFDALAYRGLERAESRFTNGLIDREYHAVYVLSLDRPLREFRPDPREVIGVAAFRIDDVLGDAEVLEAAEGVSVSDDGSVAPASVVARRDEFVPYSRERLARMLGRT